MAGEAHHRRARAFYKCGNAARHVTVVLSLYYPHIAQIPKTQGTLISCCAPGELHEIGVRMFADLCELRGYHVIFWGANVSSYRFVDDVMHSRAELIGISATMPTSIAQAAALIKKIKIAKISDIKIIIGGYAFTQSPALWQQTGVDFSAENAQSALAIIDTLAKKT